MEVWSFFPDNDLTDSYESLTDLMRAGSEEKRIVVRKNPQREIKVKHILQDSSFAYFRALAKRISSSNVAWIPLWIDATEIYDVGSTDTVFTFSTTRKDFTNFCLLWADYDNFEILEISSMDANSITTLTGSLKNYSKCIIVPIREAYAYNGFSTSRSAFNNYLVSCQFKVIDDVEYGASFSTTMFKGAPLIPYRPNRTRNLEEIIVDTTVQVDNGSGPFTVHKLLDYTDFNQTVEFNSQDRDKILDIRDFVCSLEGRSNPFWLPSFFNEIELLNNANASAIIRRIMPVADYVGLSTYLELNDDTIFLSRITSSVASGDNVQISFEVSLGQSVSPSDVLQFCFMTPVRSDTDKFEFLFTPGISAVISFSVTEVPEVL